MLILPSPAWKDRLGTNKQCFFLIIRVRGVIESGLNYSANNDNGPSSQTSHWPISLLMVPIKRNFLVFQHFIMCLTAIVPSRPQILEFFFQASSSQHNSVSVKVYRILESCNQTDQLITHIVSFKCWLSVGNWLLLTIFTFIRGNMLMISN